MTPSRLREIASMLPGYVCGQIESLADAWESDIADGREEAAKMQRWAEEAAAAENANARDLQTAIASIHKAVAAERKAVVEFLRVGAFAEPRSPLGGYAAAIERGDHHDRPGYPTAQEVEELQRVYDEPDETSQSAPRGNQ